MPRDVALAFDDAGALESAEAWSSSDAGHDVALAFDDVAATLTITEAGQVLTASGDGGELVIDGNTLHIDAVQTLTITADASGAITGVDAEFPGTITFEEKNGELTVNVVDAAAHLDTADGTHLTASFAEAEVLLHSENISLTLTNGTLTGADRSLSLHVDSARVKEGLGKALDLEILDLTVGVESRDDGTLASLDATFSDVIGHVKTTSILARTEDGELIRFHLETGEDGTAIKSAFLLIPEGGEVQITDHDLEVVLGPQRLSFEDVGGVYQLRADDLDVEASTKDMTLTVKGGTAEIQLDQRTGDLIISEITGTEVDLKSGPLKVHVDLEEVRGFVVKAAGISGDATGMEIRLIPTSDASVLTAEVRAKVAGIPIVLELDDVHELQAMGEVSFNQVHFAIGDPSGQGKVHVGLGPLHLRGSTVEAVARYQGYDADRMVSLVGRVLSEDGIKVTRGLSIDPDGVVRLKTGPHSPLAASATVVLPRGTGATPLYLIDLHDGAADRAPGLLFEIGPRFGARTERSFAPSLQLGLLPGSYVDWTQLQGRASVLHIPLKDHFQIPTTAVAALRLDGNGPHARVTATAGAFLNPAGLVPAGLPLYDANLGGAFAGLGVRTKNVDALLDATADLDRAGHLELRTVRLTVNGRF